METFLSSLPDAAAAVLGMMFLLWLVSLAKEDVSIVDIAWAPGFALAAWVHAAGSVAWEPRKLLVLVLVSLWGLRLGAYIGWRGRGHGEDYRYATMRKERGPSFRWLSLVTVFFLQGLLILIISLPLAWAVAQPGGEGWRWSDGLGLLLWLVGFSFEAIGDWQMGRFKADPANRGKVLDSGLWAYTRHPNYFGDACLWWGYYAFALSLPGGVWTLPAPILMTFFLLKVSGVALLERTITERRPKYQQYIESTSAFFPWPPRRGSSERGGD